MKTGSKQFCILLAFILSCHGAPPKEVKDAIIRWLSNSRNRTGIPNPTTLSQNPAVSNSNMFIPILPSPHNTIHGRLPKTNPVQLADNSTPLLLNNPILICIAPTGQPIIPQYHQNIRIQHHREPRVVCPKAGNRDMHPSTVIENEHMPTQEIATEPSDLENINEGVSSRNYRKRPSNNEDIQQSANSANIPSKADRPSLLTKCFYVAEKLKIEIEKDENYDFTQPKGLLKIDKLIIINALHSMLMGSNNTILRKSSLRMFHFNAKLPQKPEQPTKVNNHPRGPLILKVYSKYLAMRCKTICASLVQKRMLQKHINKNKKNPTTNEINTSETSVDSESTIINQLIRSLSSNDTPFEFIGNIDCNSIIEAYKRYALNINEINKSLFKYIKSKTLLTGMHSKIRLQKKFPIIEITYQDMKAVQQPIPDKPLDSPQSNSIEIDENAPMFIKTLNEIIDLLRDVDIKNDAIKKFVLTNIFKNKNCETTCVSEWLPKLYLYLANNDFIKHLDRTYRNIDNSIENHNDVEGFNLLNKLKDSLTGDMEHIIKDLVNTARYIFIDQNESDNQSISQDSNEANQSKSVKQHIKQKILNLMQNMQNIINKIETEKEHEFKEKNQIYNFTKKLLDNRKDKDNKNALRIKFSQITKDIIKKIKWILDTEVNIDSNIANLFHQLITFKEIFKETIHVLIDFYLVIYEPKFVNGSRHEYYSIPELMILINFNPKRLREYLGDLMQNNDDCYKMIEIQGYLFEESKFDGEGNKLTKALTVGNIDVDCELEKTNGIWTITLTTDNEKNKEKILWDSLTMNRKRAPKRVLSLDSINNKSIFSKCSAKWLCDLIYEKGKGEKRKNSGEDCSEESPKNKRQRLSK